MAKHTLVVDFDGDGPAYAAGDTVLGGRLVAVDFGGDRLEAEEELLEALTRLSAQCERLRLPGQRQTGAEANALAVIAKAAQ